MSQLLRIILIVLVLAAAVLVWMEFREDGSRRLSADAEASHFALWASRDKLAGRQPAFDEEQAEEIPIRFAP